MPTTNNNTNVGAHGDSILNSGLKNLKLDDNSTITNANILTPPPSEDKTLATQKSSSNHSDHETKHSSSNSSGVNLYLESLKEERDQLSNLTDGMTHVFSLIEKEMKRVAEEGDAPAATPTTTTCNSGAVKTEQPIFEDDGILKKIMPIPVDLYPNYNFVGRILGPRGTTAKQLEATTGCKIMVQGRKRELSSCGDSADASSEDANSEPLRIEISVSASAPDAVQKLEMGVTLIKALLVPPADGHDELKRQQLMVLASMNGTYRPRGAASQSFSSECGSQYQNLLPYGYRLPLAPNCQHETMLKSLLSMGFTSSDANRMANEQQIQHHHTTAAAKNECTNLKCSVLRSLVEQNIPLSNTFVPNAPMNNPYPMLNNMFVSMPKMEDMLNMMQWYELMNRMRLATSTPFPEFIKPSAETIKAQEISNRMCSSIGSYGVARPSQSQSQIQPQPQPQSQPPLPNIRIPNNQQNRQRRFSHKK